MTTNTNNHYTIELLWDGDNVELPDNKILALSHLFSLERKLKNHPSLETYKDTMQGYISQGHVSKLSKTKAKATASSRNYLPHHPVKNINKPDKISIVFDAGAKTKNKSLNKHLLKVPHFLHNLVGVLLKFHQRKYAVMDDITQMFLQVRVLPSDHDALGFLWCFRENLLVDTYYMNVHLLGKTDSPNCWNCALRKTALDNYEKFNVHVVNAVLNKFYMDDYLNSFKNVEEVITMIHGITSLLTFGGFNLGKFISNNHIILKNLSCENSLSKVVNLDFEELPTDRALRITWDSNTDMLKFNVLSKVVPETKRTL